MAILFLLGESQNTSIIKNHKIDNLSYTNLMIYVVVPSQYFINIKHFKVLSSRYLLCYVNEQNARWKLNEWKQVLLQFGTTTSLFIHTFTSEIIILIPLQMDVNRTTWRGIYIKQLWKPTDVSFKSINCVLLVKGCSILWNVGKFLSYHLYM